MTFECTLDVSGILPEVSANAFIKSYQETSKMQHYQKYQSQLEQYFQDKIDRNASQNNIHTRDNGFHIEITTNQINFISESQSAIKYEYGTDNMPPRRFIQPAVIDVANKMSDFIISDAIDVYNRNTKFISLHRQRIPNVPTQSNYFNKYSKMLK